MTLPVLALNWVWQGVVIALATAVFLRATRALPARFRCGAIWAALAAVVTLPAATWLWTTAPARTVGQAIVVDVEPVMAASWAAWVPFAVVTLWAVWTAIASARLARATACLRRARAKAAPFPADRERQLTHWQAARGSSRQATLVVSTAVPAAAVLGGRRPFIAVAPVLLETLADEELDRVVMHEHAHVRRRDDVAIVAQGALMAVAGWHPAVWWLDRTLRLEREIACDELAIAATGEPRAYAACLARLATIRVEQSALALVAVGSTSRLRSRVMRLLARPSAASPYGRWYAAAAMTILLVLAIGVARISFVEGGRRAEESMSLAVRAVVTARVAAAGAPTGPVERLARPGGQPPASVRMPVSGRRGVPVTTVPGARQPAPSAFESQDSRPPAAPAPDVAVADAPGVSAVDAGRADGPDPTSEPAAAVPTVVPAAPLDTAGAVPPAFPPVPASPWRVAAESGVAIGRTSQKAAVATAGFFNRFGKGLAGSF